MLSRNSENTALNIMILLSEYDMAPLKFTKLVGFSSEDPQFPASNLLAKGKWKCKEEGEKQAWVCLQLEELSTITNIDIGNNGAAFVEVQVGRHGCDEDQMKVLLVASSFMSVNEARVGDNAARVRMFTLDKLAAEVAREKWDLVKIIATQPFNKHSKYGVSFISLTGPPKTQPTTPISKLGAFKLMDDNVDSIAVGSYFARKKENKENDSDDKTKTPRPSVAATMRQSDTSLAEVTLKAAKKEDKKRKLEITPAAKEEIKKRRVERDFPSRLSLPGETQEVRSESPKLKKLNKPSTSKEDNPVRKEIISKNNERVSKNHEKTSLTKKKFQKFNEFLKGVHFAISGFQNPLRGEIRQKALDMGARYHGDWSSTCTHLVCAFTNTPKFNQVKGKGKIVKKEWIELCHSQRKRLPWRRFCLDKDDKNKDESEEEIFEQVDENVDCDTDEEIEQLKDDENKKKKFEKVNKTDYDCDTDEEIERIKAEENENPTAKDACASNEEESSLRNTTESSNISKEETNKYDCETDDEEGSSNDPYDAETDIDEEEIERLLPNVTNVAYDELPSFFRGKNFYVDALFPASERKLFVRYITACGGCVLNTTQSRDIEIVISKSKKKPEEIRSWDDKTLFVKPVWLFACKDADAFLDPSKYVVM